MMYFLWAFLFGILGVSIIKECLKKSYLPILKLVCGVSFVCIALFCVSKIEMPTKYDYASIVYARLQKAKLYLFSKATTIKRNV